MSTQDNKTNPLTENRKLYSTLFGDKLKWANLNERYSSKNVNDYVERCVNENYYIEAYCIVLQYIIKSIVFVFPSLNKYIKNRDLADRSIIVFLEGIGFLDSLVLKDWDQLISDRNELAHKLVDNIEIIEKYSKENGEKQIKFLHKCTDHADNFFIKYFKRPPFVYRENDPKTEHLVDIAIRNVKRSKGTWSQDLVMNELHKLLK